VHQALAGFRVAEARRFHWVNPDAGYLALRPWLRPAIAAALDELAATLPGQMTWGLALSTSSIDGRKSARPPKAHPR